MREFIASLICHATRRSSSTLAGAELSSFRRCCFETQHTTHSLALFATASLQHSVLFINIARLDQQHSSLSTKLLIIHNSHRSQQGVCEYHCNKVSSALPLLAAFRLRCLLHFTALLLRHRCLLLLRCSLADFRHLLLPIAILAAPLLRQQSHSLLFCA